MDETGIDRAFDGNGQFNLLESTLGEKVDFWLLEDSPFDLSTFARKRVKKLLGIEIALPAPEDLILQMLRWSKDLGGSERQMGDVLGVYEVEYPRLDQPYFDWALRLGVADLLAEVRRRAVIVE